MRKSLTLAAALLITGCGSTAAKYTVDNSALGGATVAERQPITVAEAERDAALAELNTARTEAENAKSEESLADAELKQARLEVDKAKLQGDMARQSKDDASAAAAATAFRIADSGKRAADAKVSLYDAKRKWRNALVDLADAKVGAANAHIEMEKAKIVAAKGQHPTKDFNLSNFTEEYAKRQRKQDDAQRAADDRHAETERRNTTWNDLNAQYQGMRAAPPAIPNTK